MSFNLDLKSPLTLLRPNYRRGSWRCRRLKTAKFQTTAQFETLFGDLVSRFPSISSLNLIVPALGLASGAAIYLSRFGSDGGNSTVSDVGEWVLFTSPTPFNRFVVMRCPSISIQGNELLEEVNEKLVKEDMHFVRLDSGRIQMRDDNDVAVEKLVYQRDCVNTDDGGVISLDWPANLDLTEEHGLDTTILLVPGNTQGSMDENVRSLVCESLRRGCFPVVMNPRGCAGSPLTTARLFTAADSDDISTAVQFISRARPWTTMMGVGWGYGANMLTKYLAEVGECTPLTAATCIDNPFDLEEASRSSPHHFVFDKLTAGLVDILQSNKELFRGRIRGFDVEKALVANSVRDFEKAISMRSYGFDAIEDFYESSSTRRLVGKVKIPVLFIQNDDGGAPMFSIPRNSIAENPFTSLVLCSCSSSVFASGRPAVSWCHHLAVEWLAAVELGLLKGRHPLLKDVDVSINLSKGLAAVTTEASDRRGRVNKFVELSESKSLNEYGVYPLAKFVGEGDSSAKISSKVMQKSQKNPEFEDAALQQEGNGSLEQKKPGDAELVEDDRGQVLQAAKVVMNMLDVTMPDTLTEEQKKKVLTAVSQGETVMKALQDVVPDDVRGKLKVAVSGFLQGEGKNLKFVKLLNISQVSTSLGKKPKVQENVGVTTPGEHENPHIPDPEDMTDSLANNFSTNEVSASGQKPKVQDNVELTSTGKHENPHSPDPKDRVDSVSSDSSGNEVPADKRSRGVGPDIQSLDSQMTTNDENASDSSNKHDPPGQPESVDDPAVDQNGGPAKLDLKEDDNIQQNIETDTNPMTDQRKTVPPTKEDQASSHAISSPEAQIVEKEASANVDTEEKNVQSVSVQGITDAPVFEVSQAFDALTEIDDSTQVAVNSVFGVIENMITQLEEGKDNKTKGDDKSSQVPDNNEVLRKEENKNKQSSQLDYVDEMSTHGETEADKEENKIKQSSQLDNVDELPTHSETEADKDARSRLKDKERLISSPEHLNGSTVGTSSNPTMIDHIDEDEDERTRLSTKSLDLDTTTDLSLDYIPEELEHRDVTHERSSNSPLEDDIVEVIEPSYVIMDSEENHESFLQYDTWNDANEKLIRTDTSEELMILVKKIVLGVLKVEVSRRLSAVNSEDMEKLTSDVEQVASAVSLAAGYSKIHKLLSDGTDSEKIGTLNGEEIVKAISLSIKETSYLRKVLPLGVVVGSSLASLRIFFNVATINGTYPCDDMALDQIDLPMKRNHGLLIKSKTDQGIHNERALKCDDSRSTDVKKDKIESRSLNNGSVMVGAFTATLGASALLAHKEAFIKNPIKDNETHGASSKPLVGKGESQDSDKLDEEKKQNNLVSSVAEKAMSVASPVVPVKKDGEMDQDRLVAMLVELGQKGGMLKQVGKIALLWGGMRGAMSLTDRLIQFLRIAERPLFQRMLAFVCMVLVLWTPTVVPLLPSLVQSWGSRDTPKFSQLVCIGGLYASNMILVMLWGKRIRGYENPIEQYGLDITSLPKIKNYLKGLIGGILLVLSIQSVNAFLGCVRLSWPSNFLSTPVDAVIRLKLICKILLLVGQGIITATGVALVEELLFRSWLPDEIAADFGPNRGIIISGLAFALFQRSLLAVPGLWLLSLSLSGARQRSHGCLSVPVGLRAGIMATSFVLQTGGFLIYKPNFPIWVTGCHPFQPLSDVVGLAFAFLLAIFLYPRQLLHQENKKREIRE